MNGTTVASERHCEGEHASEPGASAKDKTFQGPRQRVLSAESAPFGALLDQATAPDMVQKPDRATSAIEAGTLH